MPSTFSTELVAMIPDMRRWAWSLARRRDLIDDIVQDALARALSSEARFTPGSNLEAWVWVIMRNAFITRLRATRRETALDEAVHIGSCEPAQDDRMQVLELDRAMRSLSAEKREALLVVGVAGVPYDEAAAALGCAVGTLKSRVSRARTELQDVLDAGNPAMARSEQRPKARGAPREFQTPARRPPSIPIAA
jgi:RNA polymerase sigma-70 factor (ECF subfamily)